MGSCISLDTPVVEHRCWRNRQEIVVGGFHHGEHLANCFIGPARSAMPNELSDVIADAEVLLTTIFSILTFTAKGLDDREVIIRRLLLKVESDPQLNDLADALGVSRHRASHIVQELFGQSWRELRLQKRLQRAKHLLTRRHLSITAIASLCGWQDSNGFIRQFRRAYGQSPGAWRASLQD